MENGNKEQPSAPDFGFGDTSDKAEFNVEEVKGKESEQLSQEMIDAAKADEGVREVGQKPPEEPTPTEEPKEEPKADKDEKPDGELPKGLAKRVARANRQRDKARDRIEELEAENKKLKDAAADEARKVEVVKEPNAADFDDYEAYLDAKKDWGNQELEKAKKPKPEKAEEKPQDDGSVKLSTRESTARDDIIEYMKDDYPEILESVADNKDVVITGRMLMALNEMDNPETMLQEFASNPELSVEIANSKSAASMAKAMMKFDKPIKIADAPEEKGGKTSKAPDPIAPQGGNTDHKVALSNNYAEFEKQRNEEEAKEKEGWW